MDDWASRLMEQQREAPAPAPIAKRRQSRRPSRRFRAFVRGPLPLDWFEAAGTLGAKCVALGLAVWWRVGVERRHDVCLSMRSCKLFGINSRRDRLAALADLERAGLIIVERSKTKSPRVTVLELPEHGQKACG